MYDIQGGVQELIKHESTGLLVSNRYENFESAITRLYYDIKLRIELSKAAREHIIRNYSLNITTARWESFCDELIKEISVRNTLRIPDKYHLPTVRHGLDREDLRTPALPIKAFLEFKAFIRKFNQKI